MLDDLVRDVRYALRTLRTTPGFSTVAVLTLGLGIGATTTIYSVVDAILLQPLPFRDSDRLVRVVENVPSRLAGRPPVQRGFAYNDISEWRAGSRTLVDVLGVASLGPRTVVSDVGTLRLWGAMSSPDAFSLLGVHAQLGRTLVAADAADPDVVVLSFGTWRRRFDFDPSVIGKRLVVEAPETMFQGAAIERRVLTVVGVLPAGFELSFVADYYTPFVANALRAPPASVIARLRAGVTLKEALEEANLIGAAIRPAPPAANSSNGVPRFEVQFLKDQLVSGVRPALRVLLAAAVVMLVIVCANVASLLLARGSARQREFAVRFAVGAGRGRVARQVITECLVLSAMGGALGAALAAAGVTLVKVLASIEAPGIFRLVFGTSILPRANEVGIDPKMFGIAFAIAAAASVLFGVLPAFHAASAVQRQGLVVRASAATPRPSHTRAVLAVAQLMMATVLLISATLLARTFVNLSRVDSGYEPDNVLAFQLVFPSDYSIGSKTDAIEGVLTRVRAIPGVASAGFTRAGILLPEAIFVGTFVPEGKTLDEMRADPFRPRLRPVSDGYLTAMGVHLIAGRDLEAKDASAPTPAIVISRGVSRTLFSTASVQEGGRGVVGQHVNWFVGKDLAVTATVAGVVEDVRNESPDSEANPDVFIDYRQVLALLRRSGDSPRRQDEMAIGFASFAVRTAFDAASIAPTITQIVRSIDSNTGIEAMIPMNRLVASSIARQRFFGVIVSIFAGVAAVIAAIGVYGVLAYDVARRTSEIGIRMALGAVRVQVLALVLRSGALITAIGISLGIAGALLATRSLRGMLFGVAPLDIQTFAGVSIAFGLIATLASFVPAHRATRVDPVAALRTE